LATPSDPQLHAALDPALLADKVVVDAMSYWPPADGMQAMFEDRQCGNSEVVAHRLPRSTVVKTLNHLGYRQLEDERRPANSPQRRALCVAGDDARAMDVVADVRPSRSAGRR
jgi:predicted dinucleotide-binding enzyme